MDVVVHRLDVYMDIWLEDHVYFTYSIPKLGGRTNFALNWKYIPEERRNAIEQLATLLEGRIPTPMTMHIPHRDVTPIKDFDIITIVAQDSSGSPYPRVTFSWRHRIPELQLIVYQGEEHLIPSDFLEEERALLTELSRWARKASWEIYKSRLSE